MQQACTQIFTFCGRLTERCTYNIAADLRLQLLPKSGSLPLLTQAGSGQRSLFLPVSLDRIEAHHPLEFKRGKAFQQKRSNCSP